jgi:hypothetical protein
LGCLAADPSAFTRLIVAVAGQTRSPELTTTAALSIVNELKSALPADRFRECAAPVLRQIAGEVAEAAVDHLRSGTVDVGEALASASARLWEVADAL